MRGCKCSCEEKKEDKVLITKENMHKKWQTKAGLPAKVVEVDLKVQHSETSVLVVLFRAGFNQAYFYKADGTSPYLGSEFDLVQIKEKVTKYVNVYKLKDGSFFLGQNPYSSPEEAIKNHSTHITYFGVFPIELEID